MSPFARLCVRSVWLGLSCSACGATDIVATSHKSALPCDELDAAACDASVDPPPDAASDADGAPDARQPSCRPRVCSALASSDAFCRSNGSAVQVGDTCSANLELPPQSRYALCSCTALVSSLTFTADAFTSTLQRPAANAADLGVNGDLDLSGSGRIDGVIHVAGKRQLSSALQVDGVVEATQQPPCACEAARLLDVATLVRAHKQNHDNAREGLSETMLDGFRGTKELSLPCGRYFFTRLKSENQLIIRARGNVAIFIENDIELNDSLQIVTDDDTSRVSVFVAGQARTGGSLSLNGNPNGKARVNLYVQGDGTLDLTGAVDITGNVYAPYAELVTTGPLQIYGSLFVRRAAFGGEVFIHRDTEAPPACN
jgi:hypothetical protein